MRDLWDSGILTRALALLVLIAVLGITPLPLAVERQFVSASRALELGYPAAAAENLARIAEQLPWRRELWEQAGHYALAGNAPDAAIVYFKEAASRGALSQKGYLRFGDAYAQTGNDYTALQIWEASSQIFGPDLETVTRMAAAHRGFGDYARLIEALKRIISLQSSVPSDPYPLSEINYELGFLLAAYQPESAPPYLDQAYELDPAYTEARALSFAIRRALSQENPAYTLMVAGQKLADLSRWELAALAFRNAARIQPEHAEAWAYLGESQQHLGPAEHKMALPNLEKALQIDPQSLPANIFLSLYWQRQGNLETAYEYLSNAAEIDPQNPDIQTDLGALTAIRGDLEAAQEYYTKAIEITSRNPAYLQAYIEFCIRYNLNLKDIALPFARQTLSTNTNSPKYLDLMGQVLFRLGDLRSAERFLHRSLENDPDYAPAHLHLGLLYNLQDENKLANQHLSRAIELAPGTSTAALARRAMEGQ